MNMHTTIALSQKVSAAVSAINDPVRVSDLAKSIYSVMRPLVDYNDVVSEAQEAFQDAAGARETGRAGILLALADLASKHNMTDGEVGLATAQAVKLANKVESEKALATFQADCKLAMGAKVRNHVARIHSLVAQTWANEKEQPKELPRPLAKAFKREYHVFKSALVLTREEGHHVLQHACDVVAWAEEHNPDFDPKKVLGRIETMKAEIAKMYGDFPVEHLKSATEFLDEIGEEALKAARRHLMKAQANVVDAIPVTALPLPVVVATPTTVVNVEPEVEEIDPVEQYLREQDEELIAG